MTNYEHYKEQIEKITRLGFTFALNKDIEECDKSPERCEKIRTEFTDEQEKRG